VARIRSSHGRATSPHANWSDGLDSADLRRLLHAGGCVLCRSRDEAEHTWIRWFEIENHSSPDVLVPLQRSLGFCPAHTRRLIALNSPGTLRQPWTFVLRGAIARAASLRDQATGNANGPGSTGGCPLCETIATAVSGVAHTLIENLDKTEITDPLQDNRGLCYVHLRPLLPHLDTAQIAIVAKAVTGGPNESRERGTAIDAAGTDTDALARGGLHSLVLQDPERIDLAPQDRLITDLRAGSCPCCRATGRAETTYLTWLRDRPENRKPTEHDLYLCPTHLHDLASLAEPDDWSLHTRIKQIHSRSAHLAAASERLLAEPAPQPSSRLRALFQRPSRPLPALEEMKTPPAIFHQAIAAIVHEPTCRACQAAQSAETRATALMAACAQDQSVLHVLDNAHGLCLRHTQHLATQPGALAVVQTALNRLRQTAWELHEDELKQAWDLRHEHPGRERTTWRRVPTLLDGRTYLGLAERDIWPDPAITSALLPHLARQRIPDSYAPAVPLEEQLGQPVAHNQGQT
jgi:hypothetical protein